MASDLLPICGTDDVIKRKKFTTLQQFFNFGVAETIYVFICNFCVLSFQLIFSNIFILNTQFTIMYTCMHHTRTHHAVNEKHFHRNSRKNCKSILNVGFQFQMKYKWNFQHKTRFPLLFFNVYINETKLKWKAQK